MNVRTVCLSILYEGEATGYEIRRMTVEGECSYFVEASFGSIYPALAKMEAEGLVTSRVEPQDGKPAKKVYSITEAGRHEFVQSLFEPIGEEVFRSPFLLFARYAHLLPASLVEERLLEQIGRVEDTQKKLKEVLERKSTTPGDAWVVRFGLKCMEDAREYMSSHMHELIAQARPDHAAANAAE
ncbi:MAG TPA: PadR family transcriptional regulator [Devosiaceae bacterium]|jgi:DNA-binding PadR family transcriptional regulator